MLVVTAEPVAAGGSKNIKVHELWRTKRSKSIVTENVKRTEQTWARAHGHSKLQNESGVVELKLQVAG